MLTLHAKFEQNRTIRSCVIEILTIFNVVAVRHLVWKVEFDHFAGFDRLVLPKHQVLSALTVVTED